MKKAVLVTGGAGYIGSHVCKVLHGKGYLPVTLDNLSAGKADFVKFGPFVNGEVDDVDTLKAALQEHNVVAAIDMAGSIEVGESVANPLKYYHNNFACKIPFLRTLTQCGVKALVFSSTAAVYGEPEMVPIPETHPLRPKNPYGQSKLSVEYMLSDFYAAGGPAWMALRYFNAAGASPDGDIGECHEPESHLIPRACFAALGKIPELEIFGNDYPTPDGTGLRDYIHVMDLASAHVLALEALLSGAEPARYNLGNGVGTSIAEVMAAFERMGVKVPHRYGKRRAGDPARLIADTTAARTLLKWQPEFAGIDVIVKTAYDWHKKTG